ncbi:MAG: hypothetical protein PVH00_02690 [Gemmatimonadota bacterium]|jgi:hypothetical protein
MKPGALVVSILCSVGAVTGVRGQAVPSHRGVFGSGATLRWGFGPTALRDDYISTGRYTGSLPSVYLEWARFHERSGFRLTMDLARSADVRDHGVATEVTEFSLDADFLYPAGSIRIGSRRAFLFLGPSAGISMLVNDQQIASQGLEVALSFVTQISLGLSGNAVLPISDRLQAVGSLRTTLASACLRMVDLMDDDEESPFRLLGPFGANRLVVSLGVGYRALDWLVLGLGYEQRYLRVTAWDRLVSSRDHLTLAFTVDR